MHSAPYLYPRCLPLMSPTLSNPMAHVSSLLAVRRIQIPRVARCLVWTLLAIAMLGLSGCADQEPEQRVDQSSEPHVVQIAEQPDEFYGSGFDPRDRRFGTYPPAYTHPPVIPLEDSWIDVPADFDKEYFEVLDGYPVLARFEYPGEQNWPHRLLNHQGKILGKHTVESDDLLIVEVEVGRGRLIQCLCIYELVDQTAVLRHVWDKEITFEAGATSVTFKDKVIHLRRFFPIIFQDQVLRFGSRFDYPHGRLTPTVAFNSRPFYATLRWPRKYEEMNNSQDGAYTHGEQIIVE